MPRPNFFLVLGIFFGFSASASVLKDKESELMVSITSFVLLIKKKQSNGATLILIRGANNASNRNLIQLRIPFLLARSGRGRLYIPLHARRVTTNRQLNCGIH